LCDDFWNYVFIIEQDTFCLSQNKVGRVLDSYWTKKCIDFTNNNNMFFLLFC
jgi:hypothetical protein